MTAEADRMARARTEFQEAMARGCSIADLRKLKARERHAEALARLELRRRAQEAVAAPLDATPSPAPHGHLRFDAPWMMRN